MKPQRVIVVEDDPLIATDLVERIADLGYPRPEAYERGEDVLAVILETPPDLLLMDIQLAGQMDGIETVRRYRNQHPTAAVVFLTANTDEATFARARPLQPRAFLGKPFRGRDLRHTIELAIGTPPPVQAPAEQEEEESNVYRLKDRLFVKHKDRFIRLLIADILYAKADDYYCSVVTAEREYLITRTLKKFAELLPTDEGFFRTHRSYVVNLHHVEEIDHAHVRIGDARIPVSRTARDELMQALRNV